MEKISTMMVYKHFLNSSSFFFGCKNKIWRLLDIFGIRLQSNQVFFETERARKFQSRVVYAETVLSVFFCLLSV